MNKRKLGSGVEDYLEAIYFLAREKSNIRTSDIASFLGHKPPSVTEMLEKLSKDGLVEHEKYGVVSLTPRGRRIAKKISSKHIDLVSFLEVLGVDRKTAEIDACKMEHVVSPESMKRLRKFVEFAQKYCTQCLSERGEEPEWLKHYKQLRRDG